MTVRKFRRDSDGAKVKEVRDESGVLQRMVAIIGSEIMLADKQRHAILVRNRPQGGAFYVRGLE